MALLDVLREGEQGAEGKASLLSAACTNPAVSDKLLRGSCAE